MENNEKKPASKAVKKASVNKKRGAKIAPFSLRERAMLPRTQIEPQADRQVLFQAVCTFEQINLTGWTDEATADRVADHHHRSLHHPVTVLEMH